MASKLVLAKALATWDYTNHTRRALFWLLDNLLTLPQGLNDQFLETLEAEEAAMMDKMNSYERLLQRREKAALLAQGEMKGEIRGEIKGRLEGTASLLQTLLQSKFGPLPAWATTRISQADTDVLQQWGLNVLDAERIEDVFKD